MTRIRSGAAALGLAVATLAACGGGAPPNDVAEGVAVQEQVAWQARRAQLRGEAPPPVNTVLPPTPGALATLPPDPLAVSPLPAPAAAPVAAPTPPPVVPAQARPDPLAARAAAAIAAAEAGSPAALTPPFALPRAPQPATAVASVSIAHGQVFATVAAQDTTASGAERPAQMQAARVVTTPTAAPDRPAGLGPDIVSYALSTTHGVGEGRHDRRPIPQARHQRACEAFGSDDLAQEWFLHNGGPGRDRQGLDPDGDGFACGWDPVVVRSAAAAARN